MMLLYFQGIYIMGSWRLVVLHIVKYIWVDILLDYHIHQVTPVSTAASTVSDLLHPCTAGRSIETLPKRIT